MAADTGATKREHIGHVFVDHGSVVVLDPMYADVSDEDQERFLEALEARAGVRIACDEDLPDGIDHLGVWVSTGMGDGRYPVYADLIEVPGAGKRVARIVIDCLGVEDEPQSAMLREDLIEAVGKVREQTGGALDAKLPYEQVEAMNPNDPESVIARYAAWLPHLSDSDREYARAQHAEVKATLAADPSRRPWLELYFRWTITAMDAENPGAALAEAVQAERGDPLEIGHALQSLDRTSDEWEARYRPATGIVGEPYIEGTNR